MFRLNISNFVAALTTRLSSDVTTHVINRAADFDTLSDDDIRQRCADLIGGVDTAESAHRSTLRSWLLSVITRRPANTRSAEALSLAYAAFSRAPADLADNVAPDSTFNLYPEQVLAAGYLCQGSLVQMATGEGKTYAILPAIVQLLTQYPIVYVICASDYLAERDAYRTRKFWEFLDIPHNVCTRNTREEDWDAKVVYTSLHSLVFRCMQADIAYSPMAREMVYGAVILDEIDAIVLDKAFESFVIVRSLESEAFNWRLAEEIVRQLDQSDVSVDTVTMSASLSLSGERKVREHLRRNDLPLHPLVMRQAVELSYLASRIVQEGTDYIIAENRVFPIDRLSGQINKESTPQWIYALEASLGFESRTQSIPVHETIPFSILRRFPHLCGLSGTVSDNAFEYVIWHRHTVAVVPPRFIRKEERGHDIIFAERKWAVAATCAAAREHIDAGRPVLIGTHAIDTAKMIYQAIAEDESWPSDVRLITGENERDTVQFFEDAGSRPVVTVATQLAGRGIDIRLSDEVIANGGMALICFDHAPQKRHEAQFLGRVGRHGQPCYTQFVCSLDSPFFRALGSDVMLSTLERLGHEPGEAIEHPWIDRAVATAQSKMANAQLLRRANQQYIEAINLPYLRAHGRWFSMLRIKPPAEAELCAPEFIEFAVDTYLRRNIESEIKRERNVSRETAENVRAFLTRDFGDQIGSAAGGRLEAMGSSEALEFIKQHLQEQIRVAQEAFTRILHESNALDEALQAKGQRIFELNEDAEDAADSGDGEQDSTEAVPASNMDVATGSAQPDLDEVPINTEQDGRENSPMTIRIGPPDNEEVSEPAKSEEQIRLEQEFLELLERRADLNGITRRPPRAIASEVLINEWAKFLQDRRKLVHQVFAERGGATFEAASILTERIEAAFDRCDRRISRELVSNLLKSAQSNELDAVFYLYDNHQTTESSADDDADGVYRRRLPNRTVARIEGEPEIGANLTRFLARYRDIVDSSVGLTADQIRRSIGDFFTLHPVNTLRTPRAILMALEEWDEARFDQGVDPSRMKEDRIWLKRFLSHLREEGLVGPLPTVRDKTLSYFSRLLENMRDTRSLVIPLGITCYFGVLFLTSTIAVSTPGWALDAGLLSLLDRVLFAGHVAANSFLVPVLLIVYVRAISENLMKASSSALGRLILPLALYASVLVYLCLRVEWDGWLLPVIQVGLFYIAALLISRILASLTVWLGSSYQLSPLDYWFVFTIFGVVTPAFIEGSPASTFALAVGYLVGLVHLAWRLKINVTEVSFSTNLVRGGAELASDEIRITKKIFVPSSILTHFLALIIAWSSYDFAVRFVDSAQPVFLQSLSVSVYLTAGFLINLARILQETDFIRWRNMLNERRQTIVGADTGEEIRKFLSNIRQRQVLQEGGLFLVLGLVAVYAVHEYHHIARTDLPFATFVLFAGFAGMIALGHAARSLFLTVVSGGRTIPSYSIDFDNVEFDEDDSTIFSELIRRFRDRAKKILGVVAVIFGGFEMLLKLDGYYQLYEKAEYLKNYIIDYFGI